MNQVQLQQARVLAACADVGAAVGGIAGNMGAGNFADGSTTQQSRAALVAYYGPLNLTGSNLALYDAMIGEVDELAGMFAGGS